MSSCGEPTAKDELMPKKTKYDRSTTCIKCKANRGNIIIRHAVYCRNCFDPLVVTKFRRCLDPTINASSSTARKKSLKASGNALIGHSGGIGSAVTLDIFSRTYIPRTDTDSDLPGKGGRSHPRHEPIWRKIYVCHVDMSALETGGDKQRVNRVRASVLEHYPDVEFITAKLEDAFDPAWWNRVSSDVSNDVSARVDQMIQDELLKLKIDSSPSTDPTSSLRAHLSALPTPTAVQHTVATLIRLVLVHTARSLGCSHLLLGTTLTSLSISLIDSIAQGGGFTLSQETYEECIPSNGCVSSDLPPLRIVRPLHDVGMKECGAWMHWHNLEFQGNEYPTTLPSKQTIHDLTSAFIINLERDYPSTVSTIVRTCAKVEACGGSDGVCVLCLRPIQARARKWHEQISITVQDNKTGQTHTANDNSPPARTSRLYDNLCYSCKTTLTSRSPRSVQKHEPVAFPLPTWSSEIFKMIQGQESMSRDEMKSAIGDYLLD